MRDAIEFADWILKTLRVRQYLRLRERNVLINTRHRWMLRVGALFVLLLPAIILVHNTGFTPKVDVMFPPPVADLPGTRVKPSPKQLRLILQSNQHGRIFSWPLAWQFLFSSQ